MSTKRKGRTQKLLVTVPSGATAGVPVEANITLDQDYKACVGYQVHRGSLANQNYVDVGLRDSYTVIDDPAHIESFECDKSVGVNDKLNVRLIPCDGRKVYASVTPPGSPNADITVQFVFHLEDTLETIARV